MRLCCLLLFLLLFPLLAGAQQYVDLFTSQYQLSQASVPLSNQTVDISEWETNVTLPIPIDSHALITGIQYQWLHFHSAVDTRGWQDLHGIGMPLGVNWRLNARWKLLTLALPRLRSDLREVRSNHFQLGGVVLASYQSSDVLKWRYGAYYNNEFHGGFWVPLIGLYWTPTPRWEINATLPQRASATYRVSSQLQVGAAFRSQIATFRLSRDFDERYLEQFYNELHATVEWSVKRSFIIRFRAGRSFGRYYRLYDSDDTIDQQISLLRIGDDRAEVSPELDNGWLANVGLVYRFWLD